MKSLRGLTVDLGKEELTVTLKLTERCNQNCSYCQMHGEAEPMSLIDIRTAIDRLASLKRDQYNFFIFGGEPTVHPHFRKAMEYLSEAIPPQNLSINVQTNLKKSLTFYKEVLLSVPEIKFSASYQNHQIQDYKEYVKKALFLKRNNALISIDFMLEHENKDECVERFKLMSKCFLPVASQLLHGDRAEDFEEYEELFDQSEDMFQVDGEFVYTKNYVVENLKNKVKGMNCAVGYNNVFINHDGNFYLCFSHARLDQSKPCGNILSSNGDVQLKETLSKKSYICRWNTCDCEYGLPKWRENERK